MPLYPVNGALWNDWVANDGTDVYSASDTACAFATAQAAPRGACLHAGELRAVTVGGVTDCAGLTATDALDRFEWVCLPGASVRVVSARLKGRAGLSALLDLEATQPAFNTNSVTVRRGMDSATTATSTWWANPIVVPSAGGTLTNASGATNTIFAVRGQVAHSYELAAAETSLVVRQGAAIRGQSSPVVSTSASGPVWLEGFIDTTAGNGLYLADAPFSTVRNVEVSGTNAVLERCHHATVQNLRVHDGNPGSADFTGDAMLVEDVIVERNGATNLSAINIDTSRTAAARPSVYRRLRATASQQNGVFVHAGPVSLRDVVASDNRAVGLQVNGDEVRLANVVANHNGSRGVQVEGSYVAVVNANAIGNGYTNIGPNGVAVGGAANDNLYVGILSASNQGAGISAMGYTTPGSSVWAASTVADNSGDGFAIAGARQTISNIVAANNGVANANVGARMSASGWFVHNLAVANNSLSMQVDLNMDNPNSGIEPTLFTGNLQVTVASTTGSCSRVPVPYSLRGIDNLCANNGTTLPDGGLRLSDAVLAQTGLPWWSFAGPLATNGSAFPNEGDLANPSDGLAPTPSGNIIDWWTFENRYRGWVRTYSYGPGVPGTYDGGTGFYGWPGLTSRGPCLTTESCTVFDYSLRGVAPADGGTGAGGGADVYLRNRLAAPADGNQVLRHVFSASTAADCAKISGAAFDAASSRCELTFLRNAIELLDDGVGNDNGLCESAEACVVTPNYGVYQGHGALADAGYVGAGGAVRDVALVRYETNGR